MPQIIHHPGVVRPGQQHVFIAMPVGQPVEAAMLAFLWGARENLIAKDIAADLFILAGHCHVDDARNQCVYEFEKTECTDFLFIDSDTVPPCDAISQILSYDRDFVAGLYPFKGDDIDFPVRLLSGRRIEYEPDGCVEVEMVPTGFLRLRREVISRTAAVAKRYVNKEVPAPGIPLLFERAIAADGDRWGGDYNFCRKWRALGGKVYVDPSMTFRHFGTKGWIGNAGLFWARKQNKATPAFDQAVEEIKAGSPAMELELYRMAADWGNPIPEYQAPVDLLQTLYYMGKEATGPVLECGSGLSTVVLGLSGATVYALEHDLEHANHTMAMLKRYGLSNVHLHYAPLRRYEYASGKTCYWYETPDDLPWKFSLAFIDGPPRKFGRSVFKVAGHLIKDAKVVIDDAEPSYFETFKTWAEAQGHRVHLMTGGQREFAISLPPDNKVSNVA